MCVVFQGCWMEVSMERKMLSVQESEGVQDIIKTIGSSSKGVYGGVCVCVCSLEDRFVDRYIYLLQVCVHRYLYRGKNNVNLVV
jgi:hypothetical protein